MNQFIKLFLIYPLLLIAAIIIFLSTSVNYIETEKTRVVKVNTFDACREVSDFKSEVWGGWGEIIQDFSDAYEGTRSSKIKIIGSCEGGSEKKF